METVIRVFFEPCGYDTMEQMRTIPFGIVLDFSLAMKSLTIQQIKRILKYLVRNDVRSCKNVTDFDRFITEEAERENLFDEQAKLTQYGKRVKTIMQYWDGLLKKHDIFPRCYAA